MGGTKTSSLTDARTYFEGELKTVLGKHQVDARNESVDYLVRLLLRYMESKNFFAQNQDGKLEDNFLVDLYAEYLKGDIPQKKATLQRLGDICLMMSGFFAESLSRKLVDLDYYFGMGGTAYGQLSLLQETPTNKTLYTELSVKFQPFSNVLGEMSERSGLQSNKDLLRLYERWVSTGSERLRNLLSEHGINTPLTVVTKNKH